MFYVACLLGAALVCSSRGAEENFFDYACRVKQIELTGEEAFSCRQYLKNPSLPPTPYCSTLQEVFREQMRLRLGTAANTVPTDVLDKKVSQMVRTFLKDKLGLHKPLQLRHDLAQRAQWDPHFHGGSLFAEYFPKACLYLPNYEEAYDYLRLEHRKLEDRSLLIKQAMEEESFATITEVGSGYDRWHVVHAGKHMIPIYAHMRGVGAVQRQDVSGYDLCGLEEEDRYQSQQAFFQSILGDKIVRVHVGETIIPARGRENVRLFLDEAEQYYTSSKPLRIGHGTHISIEDMIRVAEKGYYIEACLSSNKRTGIVDHRSDYPLGLMLLLGVNVVIGTDGGSLYTTSLPEEYAYAVRSLEQFHAKLRESDELVQLPNGDVLCYKHLGHEQNGEQALTYRELGAILAPEILERISVETLVLNANRLLQECYPDVP